MDRYWGISPIKLARSVSIEDGRISVEMLKRVGQEVVTACTPALVTVRKVQDVGIQSSDLKTGKIRTLSAPASISRRCLFGEGASPQERAGGLARKAVAGWGRVSATLSPDLCYKNSQGRGVLSLAVVAIM